MYILDANQQGKSVKVVGGMCISDANQQGKSVKVAVCICQMTINKEKVLKLQYVYVSCQSTRKKC